MGSGGGGGLRRNRVETSCHSGNLCAMCAATSIRCLCVKRKDGQYRYRQKIIHPWRAGCLLFGAETQMERLHASPAGPQPAPPIPFTRPCLPWNKPSRLSAPARETDTGTRVTGDPRDLVGLPIPPHPPNLPARGGGKKTGRPSHLGHGPNATRPVAPPAPPPHLAH